MTLHTAPITILALLKQYVMTPIPQNTIPEVIAQAIKSIGQIHPLDKVPYIWKHYTVDELISSDKFAARQHVIVIPRPPSDPDDPFNHNINLWRSPPHPLLNSMPSDIQLCLACYREEAEERATFEDANFICNLCNQPGSIGPSRIVKKEHALLPRSSTV